MKQIRIADRTLCREEGHFRFKEKLEIARQLEKLNVDVIELPEIRDARTDVLLVRTASSFVRESVLSVAAGKTAESIEAAASALRSAAHPRIRVELPVSPVGMEYVCHKKPAPMLDWIGKAVRAAREKCPDVEFCALDATRAEPAFLKDAIRAAVEAGAGCVSVADNSAVMLPDDFAVFYREIAADCQIPVGVLCEDRNGLAAASAILAVRAGAECVKVDVGGVNVPLEVFAEILHNCGDRYGISSRLRMTEAKRTVKQIRWIADNAKNELTATPVAAQADNDTTCLDPNASKEEITAAVVRLGYDLSEEDTDKVFEEFGRVAGTKAVGAKELDAIVASVALQVPATYRLVSYVINNGNIISASAQIILEKGGEQLRGICMGNGPVDAAFLALEQIIGSRYELDDFQIQSVTEGKEAMGSALVRLRSGGKLYSGNGISTDIIGASIRAYLNAVNKIVYEETV